MAKGTETSNGAAFGIALAAMVGGGIVWSVLVFGVLAASLAPFVDDISEGFEGGFEEGFEQDLTVLRDDCDAGDLAACDQLYFQSPFGSDDEAFGSTCGGTQEERNGSCADGDVDLGALREGCEQGDLEACDDLWFQAPFGSDDETFGSTCGGTREETFGGCADG